MASAAAMWVVRVSGVTGVGERDEDEDEDARMGSGRDHPLHIWQVSARMRLYGGL